jgi:hypothetical protein
VPLRQGQADDIHLYPRLSSGALRRIFPMPSH